MTYEFSTESPQGVDDLISFMAELERQAMSQLYSGRVSIELPDIPDEVELDYDRD